ncbi:MAG TPA: 50S ribosomal protein L11 methyltransferase [Edaphocola sp.]|nr:50S ribosomal protein L11 methyltransferase [Edaphocola sp.]
MNSIEVRFKNIPEAQMPLLAGLLSAYDHNGILEEDNCLLVYFNEDEFPEADIRALAGDWGFEPVFSVITEKNWNQEWEQHFSPVVVDDFCAIRADFHQPVTGVRHELIINPKMSFGTGHHATTFLMMRQMAGLDLAGRKVLDFGCGTGILSVLAEKLGAASVTAIDIDEWSIQNTRENAVLNHCHRIDVKNEVLVSFSCCFDCIFANINRNVLLDSMRSIAGLLLQGGFLLLSGILWEKDETVIKASAAAEGLTFIEGDHKDAWAALLFQK